MVLLCQIQDVIIIKYFDHRFKTKLHVHNWQPKLVEASYNRKLNTEITAFNKLKHSTIYFLNDWLILTITESNIEKLFSWKIAVEFSSNIYIVNAFRPKNLMMMTKYFVEIHMYSTDVLITLFHKNFLLISFHYCDECFFFVNY